jgi:hypothetical protein
MTRSFVSEIRDEKRTLSEKKDWLMWMTYKPEIRRLCGPITKEDELVIIETMRETFNIAASRDQQQQFDTMKTDVVAKVLDARKPKFRAPEFALSGGHAIPVTQSIKEEREIMYLR